MVEILLSILLAVTGIARDVDPELTAIAQRRVVEIQSDFSHNGMDPRYYEVLAYNEAGPERAVNQWVESPSHAAIIFNSELTRIGCAVAVDNSGLMWYACVLTTGLVQPQAPPAPTPQPQVEAPESEAPVLLPNTAMPHEEER